MEYDLQCSEHEIPSDSPPARSHCIYKGIPSSDLLSYQQNYITLRRIGSLHSIQKQKAQRKGFEKAKKTSVGSSVRPCRPACAAGCARSRVCCARRPFHPRFVCCLWPPCSQSSARWSSLHCCAVFVEEALHPLLLVPHSHPLDSTAPKDSLSLLKDLLLIREKISKNS